MVTGRSASAAAVGSESATVMDLAHLAGAQQRWLPASLHDLLRVGNRRASIFIGLSTPEGQTIACPFIGFRDQLP